MLREGKTSCYLDYILYVLRLLWADAYLEVSVRWKYIMTVQDDVNSYSESVSLLSSPPQTCPKSVGAAK